MVTENAGPDLWNGCNILLMDRTQDLGKESLLGHERMRTISKKPKDSHMEEKTDACFTDRDGGIMTRVESSRTQIFSQHEEIFLNRQNCPKIERWPWEGVSPLALEPCKLKPEDHLTGILQSGLKVTSKFLSEPETQFNVFFSFFSLWQQPSQETLALMSESEEIERCLILVPWQTGGV